MNVLADNIKQLDRALLINAAKGLLEAVKKEEDSGWIYTQHETQDFVNASGDKYTLAVQVCPVDLAEVNSSTTQELSEAELIEAAEDALNAIEDEERKPKRFSLLVNEVQVLKSNSGKVFQLGVRIRGFDTRTDDVE